MIVQTTDELDFLHDAVVESLLYNADPGNRRLSLVATCNPDTGIPPWDGRRVRLLAEHLLYVCLVGFGHTAGEETIDRVFRRISRKTAELLAPMPNARAAASLMTVAFHSGSSLELACRTIALEDIS